MIDLSLRHMNGKRNYKIFENFKCNGKSFEISNFIDSGGNAVVYLCNEVISGDEYAIKIQLNTREDRLKRFAREIEVTSTCTHDHLIKYKGQGELESELFMHRRSKGSEALPYILMELGDKNLSQHLADTYKNSKHIKYEDYIGQFRGLASALSELHRVALHRDIKPSNILISGDKWILSDYGLSALHKPGRDAEVTKIDEKIGPQYWMSPEANTKSCGFTDDITMASDVYQLAAVFWLVVTFRHPSGILTKADWQGPDNIFQPLHDALQHHPHRRPQNGQEFAESIINSIES